MFSLDVRGSGLQGDAGRQAVWGRLGWWEARDTLAVIKHLTHNLVLAAELESPELHCCLCRGT